MSRTYIIEWQQVKRDGSTTATAGSDLDLQPIPNRSGPIRPGPARDPRAQTQRVDGVPSTPVSIRELDIFF